MSKVTFSLANWCRHKYFTHNRTYGRYVCSVYHHNYDVMYEYRLFVCTYYILCTMYQVKYLWLCVRCTRMYVASTTQSLPVATSRYIFQPKINISLFFVLFCFVFLFFSFFLCSCFSLNPYIRYTNKKKPYFFNLHLRQWTFRDAFVVVRHFKPINHDGARCKNTHSIAFRTFVRKWGKMNIWAELSIVALR